MPKQKEEGASEDVVFSSQALSVVSGWIGDSAGAEDGKTGQKKEAEEEVIAHRGKGGLGAIITKAKETATEEEKKLKRLLSKKRRREEEEEAVKVDEESDEEEESRTTAIKERKAPNDPIKAVVEGAPAAKKKRSRKKKKKKEDDAAPEERSDVQTTKREGEKTKEVPSSSARPAAASEDLGVTEKKNRTSEGRKNVSQEPGNARGQNHVSDGSQRGPVGESGALGAQQDIVQDGEERQRKRKKRRSKQKNIRKDNRPLELRPSYLRPGSADYAGRQLTDATLERLGVKSSANDIDTLVIKEQAEGVKQKGKVERKDLDKLRADAEAIEEKRKKTAKALKSAKKKEGHRIPLSRGMWAVIDKKGVPTKPRS